MKPVTFFDIISAMRDRRVMKFTMSGSEFIGSINGVRLRSRGYPQLWALEIDGRGELSWDESNTLPLIVSETT